MKPHKWKITVCFSAFFGLFPFIYGSKTYENDSHINIKQASEDKAVGGILPVVWDKNFTIDYFAEDIVQEGDERLIHSDPVIQNISDEEVLRLQFNRKRDVPEHGFREEDKKQILYLHNLYRGNVTPPAGNMAFMEWDRDGHSFHPYDVQCQLSKKGQG
ncbi:hypothetical protein TNCV_4657311 [Trichonephila clavipes]|nr:hypothetical protein TNCV_4657311 [Trichonephila clavipes]